MNGTDRAAQTEQLGQSPRCGRFALIVAALLLAVASAAVPLSLCKPWIGMVLWGVMIVGCAVLLRAMRVGVTLTLLGSGLCLLLTGTYLFAGTLAAALAVGTFACAFLMMSVERPYLVCLIPLAAFGVTAIFTRDPLLWLAALSLLPAGALTAFAMKRKVARTGVIACGAAGLLFSALLLIGLAIARTEAGLSLETVRGLLDDWHARLLGERIAMRDELLAALEQMYAETGTTGNAQAMQTMLDSYRQMFSDASLSASLTEMFDLLPGVAVAVALIASYLGQLLLLEGCEATGMRSAVAPESEFFVMSLPATVIWIVASVISLIADSSSSVAVITAQNLSLILLPGFCAAGWYTLARAMRSIPPRGRWSLILPSAALLCCASTSLFWVLGVYGAYATAAAAIRRAILRRNAPPSGGNGDGGDGDGDGDAQ